MQGATTHQATNDLVTALADQATDLGWTADDVAALSPAEWVYLRSHAGHGYGPEPSHEVKGQVITVLRDRAAHPDPFEGLS
jgi:hypothetical protein